MKAVLHTRRRVVLSDTELIEMTTWEVPRPVTPSVHQYKYRLVYVANGVRLVGFDNERGKGDHRHLEGAEYPYVFLGPGKLINDFLAEVRKRREQ